jgi:hypothetical protein
VERAREEGHVEMRGSVLAENAASQAMLRRAGFRRHPAASGALIEMTRALNG